MDSFLIEQFVNYGATSESAALFTRGVLIGLVLVLSLAAKRIAQRILLSAVAHLISHTQTDWDDALLKAHFFTRLAHLVPAVVIYLLSPILFEGFDRLITLATNGAMIYMIAAGIFAVDAFLNGAADIYESYEISKDIPSKVFVQILKIIVIFVGLIFIVSIVLGKTPLYLFSGLGAITAILMLIFKDAILGFVAGIQLTANRMVSVGDWIEMPKYGADGDVIEVALTTVKVRNWDKTITTIPTYALISESFKNWRGMSESGGRRIKRALSIDLNSIRFCTEEMLDRFQRIQFLSEYIAKKRKEVLEYNAAHQIDERSLVNGRRITNIGSFRAYTLAYLKSYPKIDQQMTLLVRQLAPTEHGLPIEIYVFSNDIAWANYEGIQSDIFDHLFAILREFDLRVFQNPTGSDFRSLKQEHGED